MKNIAFILSSLLFFVMVSSCKKTISGDTPLTAERKLAVYITTENNSLISFDAGSGKKNWEISLKGIVDGSPLLYRKKIYLITTNGYLYSIDMIRGTIWRETSIGLPTTHSLAAIDGKIYIASDKLYCYDTTFNLSWSYDTKKQCTTSPTLANGKIFVAASDTLFSISSNGNLNWKFYTPGAPILSSPKVTNSLVYFGARDKNLYAINESDGTQKWTYLATDEINSSPMVYGGMCIVGCNDYGVYCVDTTSGILRWKVPTKERVISSPSIHEFSNTVFVGSYDFNLYAIDHVSGAVKWKYPAGSLIKSSPVVYGDNVYFNTFDKYLYCVNIYSGKTVWKSFINANSQSSPLVDNLSSGIHSGISGMSEY